MSSRLFAFRISVIPLMALVFVSFLVWAALFEIDQTVRAQGTVIASSRTQIIQAVDGGVLSEILVREGQEVKQGQRLALFDGKIQQEAVGFGAYDQIVRFKISIRIGRRAVGFTGEEEGNKGNYGE